MGDEGTGGQEKRRWRKMLQKLGAVAVRRQLQQSADDDTSDSERSGKQTGSSNPPRQFIDAWYREGRQRARRAKYFRAYALAVLALAAVAAGILFLAVQ